MDGAQVYQMVGGLGDAFSTAYASARKERLEEEAPAIFDKLIAAQSGGTSPAVASSAGPAAPAVPAFAGGGGLMRMPGMGGATEDRFIGALREGGLTNPYGVAAMAAYANHESGYKGSAITGSWSDPSESGQAGTSGGILSWRGDRFANMRRLTAGAADPVVAQAKFALTENPDLTLALQRAQSPEDANRLMANAWRFAGFNRPGGEFDARLGTTQRYVTKLGGGTAPAQAQVASVDPEAADKPADGAVPAGFQIPGDAPAPTASGAAQPAPAFSGFQGFGQPGAQRMTPDLREALNAAWRNPNTRSVAASVFSSYLTGKGTEWSLGNVGDQPVLFNPKTAQVVPIGSPKVERTSEQKNFDQSLSDPRFQGFLDAQRRPLTPTIVSPGQTVLPPGEYGVPSFQAPPKEEDTRTAEQKDYAAAKEGGYAGSFTDFINLKGNANRAQTTINNAVNPVLKGLGDQFVESRAGAQSSADSVRSIQNARSQLDAPGGIYSGAFAENRLALQKLGAALGVAEPGTIQNTETFRTQIKPIVLDTVKGLGAGSGISNADRDFALEAVGGKITLDEGTIRRVLDITERAARSKIDRHNALSSRMLETQPELKQVGPMLQVEQPAAPPPSAAPNSSPQAEAPKPAPTPSPAPAYGSVKIPMAAVGALRADPALREQFDAKYGKGASDRVLGRTRLAPRGDDTPVLMGP